MSAPPLSELVTPIPGARSFTETMRPGLGDCAPSGRIRLDALARWLQDVAYDDVEDAGLADLAYWVVRRNRLRVERWPRFAERFQVRTFCSGLGRMWAERRTTLSPLGDGIPSGDRTPAVEAVAIWVHLDPVSRRPMPFTAQELECYGAEAAARRVTARLHHPPPDGAARSRSWAFRATDCDIAGHVNNAAYWQPLEQDLLEEATEPLILDAEMEFRTPAQPGEKLVARDGALRWILDPAGVVHASVIALAEPPSAG